MNAATKDLLKNATFEVRIETSQFGNPQPTLRVRFAQRTHHRVINATLHMLAAELELATPAHEGWVVQIADVRDRGGRIVLELADATPAEAERAATLLNGVIKG